ncbi:hypothetical protein ACHQM5_029119 [Ranunculus cassubicifolius]
MGRYSLQKFLKSCSCQPYLFCDESINSFGEQVGRIKSELRKTLIFFSLWNHCEQWKTSALIQIDDEPIAISTVHLSDPGWKHGTTLTANKKKVRCNYCGKNLSGVSWWESYGMDAPNLRRVAIRILSQTCSTSGCERNWSTFDQIYTKKRNKLKQEKVATLVFIHYNLRLRERHLRRHGSSYDPINLNNILLNDYSDEWISGNNSEDVPADEDPIDPEIPRNFTEAFQDEIGSNSAYVSNGGINNGAAAAFANGGWSFTNLLQSQHNGRQ